MKVLLWEMGDHFQYIVLWDGENTYWDEDMKPSPRYSKLKFNKIDKLLGSRFTYIGEFD